MLKDITTQLLYENHHGKLREAANQFYSLLANITGIKDDPIADDSDIATATLLNCGNAISPKYAARCVLDYCRTTQFLRGTHAAVLECQNRFPNQTINILYAGCGPFAPLVLPLCVMLEEGKISLTLIDIHEISLTSARKIFGEFGLSNFVRDFVQCDATEFKADTMPHILIAETMQKALAKEPQVAITLSLAPQLPEGGLLIPQSIEIDACLSSFKDKFLFVNTDENTVTERKEIPLGRLLEISAENVGELKQSIQQDSSGVFSFPPHIIEIPDDVDGHDVMLLTKVKIFDRFMLGDCDSGITYPTTLHDLDKPKGKTRIEFRYSLSNPVGFKYQVL